MSTINIPYYDYYFGSKELSESLVKEFEPLKSARIEIYLKAKLALDEFCEKKDSAIEIVVNDSWLGSKVINGWAIHPESDNSIFDFLKKFGSGEHNGEHVLFVSGRGNTKIGKKINQFLTDTNEELSKYPSFNEWVIKKLGLFRTGEGAPTSSGCYALRSSCGFCNGENIIFRIPKGGEALPEKLNLTPMTIEEFTNITDDKTQNKFFP